MITSLCNRRHNYTTGEQTRYKAALQLPAPPLQGSKSVVSLALQSYAVHLWFIPK